jgi:flagellar protein FlbD
MIKVTRLNGEEFIVNADLIQFVESRPDTYITLTTADRLIVRESVDEVVARCVSFARTVRVVPGLRAG